MGSIEAARFHFEQPLEVIRIDRYYWDNKFGNNNFRFKLQIADDEPPERSEELSTPFNLSLFEGSKQILDSSQQSLEYKLNSSSRSLR